MNKAACVVSDKKRTDQPLNLHPTRILTLRHNQANSQLDMLITTALSKTASFTESENKFGHSLPTKASTKKASATENSPVIKPTVLCTTSSTKTGCLVETRTKILPLYKFAIQTWHGMATEGRDLLNKLIVTSMTIAP